MNHEIEWTQLSSLDLKNAPPINYEESVLKWPIYMIMESLQCLQCITITANDYWSEFLSFIPSSVFSVLEFLYKMWIDYDLTEFLSCEAVLGSCSHWWLVCQSKWTADVLNKLHIHKRSLCTEVRLLLATLTLLLRVLNVPRNCENEQLLKNF